MVPDPPAAMREMSRITKTGGIIAVLTWRPPTHSQFHGLLANLNKHIAVKTEEAKRAAEALATGIPATAAPAPIMNAAQAMQLPFSTDEAYSTLFDSLGLETVSIESYTSIGRTYQGVEDFWTAIQTAAPGRFIHGVVDKEQRDRWAKEYLAGIWGEFSPFSISFTAVIAIARKKAEAQPKQEL